MENGPLFAFLGSLQGQTRTYNESRFLGDAFEGSARRGNFDHRLVDRTLEAGDAAMNLA
jgi:hypothetical protein